MLPALASLIVVFLAPAATPAVFQLRVLLPLVDPLVDPQRGRAGEGLRGWYPEMEKKREMEMEPSAGTKRFVLRKSRRLEK